MTNTENPRTITLWEFAALGLEQLAYVKRVATSEGPVRYAIHAADGTEMGVTENFEAAFAAVREHDMEPVSVH